MLRHRRILRAAEPALAAGATIVIGYGLAGRLVPGVVELAHSRSAAGRLEQPITYWNAEGALAAFGLVLCARLAGDPSRPRAVRVAAAAAVAPLGAGVYLSYSRGAIAAAVLGLVVLVALAPTRAQLRAAAVALGTAVAAAAASALFRGPAALEGALSDRIREGVVALGLLLAVAICTGVWTARRSAGDEARLAWSHRLAPVAIVAVIAVVAGLIAGGLGERPSRAELATGAGATRLTTASSNRYEYWRIGLDAFAREPFSGLGSGGFRVEWLRKRSFPETVKDAHSIEVEMAAELGLVGLAAFALMLGGTVAAGRAALRHRPSAAAGSCAATLVWLVHASIDWDWQLPAVTLPAIALAGALIALAETRPADPPEAAAAPPALTVAS